MNENVTPEALARLEAMEKAATPRPWHVHGEHVHAAYDNSEGRLQHHAVAVTHDLNAGRYGNEGTKATNAALILAARNALPDLIAEIRRLRASVNEAITWCEQCKGLERKSPMQCARCQTFVGLLAVAGAAKEESDGE